MLEEIAFDRNKIPVFIEFTYGHVPDTTWWTNVLFKSQGYHKISYPLTWRNGGVKASRQAEYHLPCKRQVSEDDFVKFYNHPNILFHKDITTEQLYK